MRDEEYIGKLIMSDSKSSSCLQDSFFFFFSFSFQKKKILDLKTLISRDEFVSDLKDPTPTYGQLDRGESRGEGQNGIRAVD